MVRITFGMEAKTWTRGNDKRCSRYFHPPRKLCGLRINGFCWVCGSGREQRRWGLYIKSDRKKQSRQIVKSSLYTEVNTHTHTKSSSVWNTIIFDVQASDQNWAVYVHMTQCNGGKLWLLCSVLFYLIIVCLCGFWLKDNSHFSCFCSSIELVYMYVCTYIYVELLVRRTQ